VRPAVARFASFGGASRIGALILGAAIVAAVAAPFLAPHAPGDHADRLLNAPPTVPQVRDDSGAWHAPFIYPWRLVNQLEQRMTGPIETRSAGVAVERPAGRVVGRRTGSAMLPGADSLDAICPQPGLFGARLSLGLAARSPRLGASAPRIRGWRRAGYIGGVWDDVLMRATDFVMVLPAIYVALALRAVLPLVLPPRTLFAMLAGIFAVVGAPFIARGVRAIVRSERRLDYASAAEALGASGARLLARHLLPATRGFIVVQITLLVPAFIVAEATLSAVGLGFPDPIASWGTMLNDASSKLRVFADFPWLLSPAVAMFLVVFSLNLVVQQAGAPVVYNERS
jgi:peptide/nickel transport system permease protein